MKLPTQGRITYDFYKPVNYIKDRTKHEALDIVTDGYQPLKTITDATVIKIIDIYTEQTVKGYGNEVWLKHATGIISRSCHMKSGTPVTIGQELKEGDVYGYTGRTGYRVPSSVIHVHYEEYENDKRIDPLKSKNQTWEAPKNNISNNKKPMKLLENRRCVWVKDPGATTADYWVIRTNKEHPLETRHRVPSKQTESVASLFGPYGKLKRAEWPEIAGLTEKGEFDIENLSRTHPELFEL